LVLVLILKKKYHLEDLGVRQEDNIEMNLKGTKYEVMDCIRLRAVTSSGLLWIFSTKCQEFYKKLIKKYFANMDYSS